MATTFSEPMSVRRSLAPFCTWGGCMWGDTAPFCNATSAIVIAVSITMLWQVGSQMTCQRGEARVCASSLLRPYIRLSPACQDNLGRQASYVHAYYACRSLIWIPGFDLLRSSSSVLRTTLVGIYGRPELTKTALVVSNRRSGWFRACG